MRGRRSPAVRAMPEGMSRTGHVWVAAEAGQRVALSVVRAGAPLLAAEAHGRPRCLLSLTVTSSGFYNASPPGRSGPAGERGSAYRCPGRGAVQQCGGARRGRWCNHRWAHFPCPLGARRPRPSPGLRNHVEVALGNAQRLDDLPHGTFMAGCHDQFKVGRGSSAVGWLLLHRLERGDEGEEEGWNYRSSLGAAVVCSREGRPYRRWCRWAVLLRSEPPESMR